MNFDGDAIVFNDNSEVKYPKTVTYALSENKTLIANEAGLSGNY